jgi:hypothetical protein
MKIKVNEDTFKALRRKRLEEDYDLSVFQMKDTLCPDIFDENEKMIPEVRKNLLKIGEDFYKYLAVEWAKYEDIILTGSLANYNWSNSSDLDLHVILPFEDITKNKDLANNYTYAQKELWNDKHDINIKNFPVELYAQDSEGTLVAGGIYSVLFDKWIKKPERTTLRLDEAMIQKLINFFQGKIDSLYKKYTMGNFDGLLDEIDAIKKAIADMRKKGLNEKGEFSSGNIAFKSLRRMGLLEKLGDMKSDVYDSELSFGEKDTPEPVQTAKPQFEPEKESDEDKKIQKGLGRYSIFGRRFTSLRQAERKLGIPKSTLQYRVKSDSPEFSQYKELPM